MVAKLYDSKFLELTHWFDDPVNFLIVKERRSRLDYERFWD